MFINTICDVWWHAISLAFIDEPLAGVGGGDEITAQVFI
jgi:hypothetical protein